MSDTQGWYARKVAAFRGQSSAPAPPATQYAPVQQQAYRGIAPQTMPPHLQPQQEQPRQAGIGFDGKVTIENFVGAMSFWKGGKGQQERERCPNCGDTLWSRTNGTRRGPPPAPLCYHCGYNGMFEQGLPSSWGGN